MRYLKIYKKNFVYLGKDLGSTIEAKLIPANIRIIRWNMGRVVDEREWRDMNRLPPGWEPAYDVDLRLRGGLHRLTIHSATAIRDFQPYLRKLASEGKRLEDVVTRMTITSRRKLNPSVKFEMVK
ncbi:hypothetical protein [Maridesulfovibrio ferrireducens]|uniref:hypothetical protein n=1 Tax=Maridesulfovibrio ferrireducens TaxID=246191 RepID=UPI001A2599B3|nr:hypothetical protein [Maridesulfovibrio ferrireducens]MBI9113182.1 hypothetical protein [Maridesulfovibrio ferrireducens]